MRSHTLLALLAAIAAACAHRTGSPIPLSGNDSSIASVAVNDTSQPAVRAALQRATQAADEVDTIVVRPDSIVLHVGQPIMPWGVLRIEARNAAGARIAGFAPFMDVEDRSIVEFRGTDFVGRRVGTTRLVITPMTLDDSLRARAPRSFVTLRVEP